MPTYVYKFVETGETFEVQQSFDEASLVEATHPVTGDTMAVKKVFTPLVVTFKGDGFYKTDSRSSKGKSTTSSTSDGKSSDSSSTTPSTSTDSKSSDSSSTSSASSASTSSSSSSSSTNSTPST